MKKLIILDANILVRAVLGERVSSLLTTYSDRVEFFTASVCYDEVRKHLPKIMQKRKKSATPFLEALELLPKIVEPIEESIYSAYEAEAKRRIEERDIDDWPLIALSLSLNCPVWTEDKDFFGTGVSTWRTRNV